MAKQGNQKEEVPSRTRRRSAKPPHPPALGFPEPAQCVCGFDLGRMRGPRFVTEKLRDAFK